MRIVTAPIFPRLSNNEVVSINGERYRAEFWHSHKENYYIFAYVGENGKENFTRSENEVSQAIIDKKIKRF